MNIKKLKLFIPLVILFALLILLWHELFYAKPGELPSALIGEKIPTFSLPTLFTQQTFTDKDLLRKRVVLLNVWATWCYACGLEQTMLLKIKNEYHIPIYSIDYKDTTLAAKQWLDANGNPYLLTGNDQNGDVAIDFGVYGTPETFVISPQGKIIYRQIGAIDQSVWDNILLPLIKKYE